MLPVPSYITLIEGYDEIISKSGLDPMILRTWVANEHTRERANGSTVFYREMHLPTRLLKGVYAKKEATREEVGSFFTELGLDIQVRKV